MCTSTGGIKAGDEGELPEVRFAASPGRPRICLCLAACMPCIAGKGVGRSETFLAEKCPAVSRLWLPHRIISRQFAGGSWRLRDQRRVTHWIPQDGPCSRVSCRS